MLVVFDFDGTLADTYPIFRDAFDDAARELKTPRYRRDEESYVRTLEAGEVLRFHGIDSHLAAEFVSLLRQAMEARIHDAKIFPGIREVLEQLQQQEHSLALVSSNSGPLISDLLGGDLRKFGMQSFEIALRGKTQALQEAASSTCAVNGICFVGDEIRDAVAARNADVTFGAAAWGYNTDEALRRAGASEVLYQPSDIVGFVERASRQR